MEITEKQIRDLDSIVEIQTMKGNYDCNAYMWGLANGLILARAIVHDKSPQYLPKPEKWLDFGTKVIDPSLTYSDRDSAGDDEC